MNLSIILSDLTEEEFLKTTTQTKKCIVHFYHPDFKRCEVMHAHLLVIISNLPNVLFVPKENISNQLVYKNRN